MKKILLKSLAILMMLSYSISSLATSAPEADDGKWYYVKSQRYQSGGPWWTLGENNFVVPGALTKADNQKFTVVSIGEDGKVTLKSESGLLFTAKAYGAEGGNWDENGPATGWDMIDNTVDGFVGKAFPGENAGIHQGASSWTWRLASGWYQLSDHCTFFFYEASEDLDLHLAIDDAKVLLSVAIAGEDPGDTPESAIDNFQDAIDAATLVLGLTDEEEITNAIAVLESATLTFKNAVIPVVQDSTEEAPIWYLIKNVERDGKGSTVFATTSNGRLEGTSVANSIPADGTGTGATATKLAHLFRFERHEDGSYSIFNAAFPGSEVVRTAGGGNSSQEVKLGATNGSTWSIKSLGYSEGKGVYAANIVGVQTGTDWHMHGSYFVVSYSGGINTASAWYFEEFTGDANEVIRNSYNEFLDAAKELRDNLEVGSRFNQIPTEVKNSLEVTVGGIEESISEISTIEDYLDAISQLETAIEDTKLSIVTSYDALLPQSSHSYAWFRIASTTSNAYAKDKVISLGDRVTGEEFTYEDLYEGDNESEDKQLFRFELNEGKTAIVNIINKAEPNTYLNKDGSVSGEALSGDNFTLHQLLDGYSFNINPSGSTSIHAQDTGTTIVNWNGGAKSASAWKLIFVNELTTDVATITENEFNIQVVDGVISIQGVETFETYNLSGQKVNGASRLPNGVYIVKVGEFAQKVLVK